MVQLVEFCVPNEDLVSELKNLCPNKSYEGFGTPLGDLSRGSKNPFFEA